MAVSLSTIRTQVRSYLDETTAADWTDAELNRLINQRYHRVYSAVFTVFEEYRINYATADTVADQQEYSLPSDCLKIRRIEINYDMTGDPTAFQKAAPVTNIDAVRNNLSGTTAIGNIHRNPVYYLLGDTIGFLPVPTLVGDEAIKLWYVPIASDLDGDSATIDIPYPERYYHVIAEGAAADAYRFGEQNSTEADKFDQKFVAGILLMQEELEDRIAEDSKYVIDVTGENLDFGGGF